MKPIKFSPTTPSNRPSRKPHGIRAFQPWVWAMGLGCVTGLGLSACSSLPQPAAPQIEVGQAFKEATTTGVLFMPAQAQATAVPDAWWKSYRDPALDALVQRLDQRNPNLQAAKAAVDAAQAALSSAKVSWWPTVNASVGATRSSNVSTSPPGTSYNLQGNFSGWELDLWNRIGANVQGAEARLQASADTLAATRLSLQASMVQTYFSWRTAQAQGQLLEQSVQAWQRFAELTRHRHQAGVAAASDVALADSQLKSVQVQWADNRLQARQQEHALALLAGETPAQFSLPAASLTGSALPDAPAVPLQLPSQLLERRPDIAAAQKQVMAANAQIGAAQAAFFPVITLGASGGYRGSDFASLVQSANKFWSVGPALTLNLFSGFAQTAALESARATHEQAVANYRQTVLSAFQEVEDNLAAATVLSQENQLQREALAAARLSLDLAQAQYKAGTLSALQVVSAQTTELSTRINQLNTHNRLLVATAQLLKNLAGRWLPTAA